MEGFDWFMQLMICEKKIAGRKGVIPRELAMVILEYLKFDVFGQLLLLTSWNKVGEGHVVEMYLYTCHTGKMVKYGPGFKNYTSQKPVALPGRKLILIGGVFKLGTSSCVCAEHKIDGCYGEVVLWKPLNHSRFRHTATLLDSGHVLVIGGSREEGRLTSMEMRDPATLNWTLLPWSLPFGRDSHCTIALNATQVLITGGVLPPHGQITDTCILFDVTTGAMTKMKPMLKFRMNHAAVLLPNGSVLISGGSGDGVHSHCEIYRLDEYWTVIPHMNFKRERHALCVLPNTRTVMAIGGGPRLDGKPLPCEIFSMDTLKWTIQDTPMPDHLYEAEAVVLKN